MTTLLSSALQAALYEKHEHRDMGAFYYSMNLQRIDAEGGGQGEDAAKALAFLATHHKVGVAAALLVVSVAVLLLLLSTGQQRFCVECALAFMASSDNVQDSWLLKELHQIIGIGCGGRSCSANCSACSSFSCTGHAAWLDTLAVPHAAEVDGLRRTSGLTQLWALQPHPSRRRCILAAAPVQEKGELAEAEAMALRLMDYGGQWKEAAKSLLREVRNLLRHHHPPHLGFTPAGPGRSSQSGKGPSAMGMLLSVCAWRLSGTSQSRPAAHSACSMHVWKLARLQCWLGGPSAPPTEPSTSVLLCVFKLLSAYATSSSSSNCAGAASQQLPRHLAIAQKLCASMMLLCSLPVFLVGYVSGAATPCSLWAWGGWTCPAALHGVATHQQS
jgi:hypothetical protein